MPTNHPSMFALLLSVGEQHPLGCTCIVGPLTPCLGTCNCLKEREGGTKPRWIIGRVEQGWRARRSPDILVAMMLHKQIPAKFQISYCAFTEKLNKRKPG